MKLGYLGYQDPPNRALLLLWCLPGYRAKDPHLHELYSIFRDEEANVNIKFLRVMCTSAASDADPGKIAALV